MTLERGKVARIDRKVLSGLGHEERWQTVRVPISAATWSAWRRYCEAAGVSMGRAIALLVTTELRTVVEAVNVGEGMLEGRVAATREAREAELAARRAEIEATEQRLRNWDRALRSWEERLERQEQVLQQASTLAARPAGPRVGRNDRCPCGSGLKYKQCHGLDGGRQGSQPYWTLGGGTLPG